MKRFCCIFLIIISLLVIRSIACAEEIDISYLILDDLEVVKQNVDKAIAVYHTDISYKESDTVLDMVKDAAEKYLRGNGAASVSWPWIGWDYKYKRNWDWFSVNTHLDYKDNNDKNHRVDVYGEVFLSGKPELICLKLGDEMVLDQRTSLPSDLWQNVTEHFIDLKTGTDLTVLSEADLRAFKKSIEEEIKQNHKPTSAETDKTYNCVKNFIETYCAEKGCGPVSWPWFDFSYTREWNLYTEKTRVTYDDSMEVNHRNEGVYAEVHFADGEPELIFLTLDNVVLVDQREQCKADDYVHLINSRKYSEALDHMDAQEYDKAAAILESLGDFAHSLDRLAQCENEITEIKYQQAVACYLKLYYNEALPLFEQLGEYKDSAELADKCRRGILKREYSHAEQEFAAGHYETARELFLSLGDFEDSAQKADDCTYRLNKAQYEEGKKAFEAGLFEQAMGIFAELGIFEDSQEQYAICEEAKNEGIYQEALALMNDSEYSEAIRIFSTIADFKDSQDQIARCQETINRNAYDTAVSLMTRGHFSEAKDIFLSLDAFDDSPEMVVKCTEAIDSIDRVISFPEETINLYVNKTYQLTPSVVSAADGSPVDPAVTYMVQDKAIVTATKSGQLTANKAGTTTILCTAADNPNIIDEVTVNVILPVRSVSIDPLKITLPFVDGAQTQETVSLAAVVLPENAFDRSVTWSSSKEEVVTVDENGQICPVSIGKAIITAVANDKTGGEKKATCSITVEKAVTGVQLDKTSGTVYIGKTEKLTATVLPADAANKKLTWTSSDPKVATVTNGTVKGIASGTATITATSVNGVVATYTATVKQGPATFSVTMSARCIAKNHVGSRWTKEFYLEDERFSGSKSFKAEVDQVVTMECWITENDDNPDCDGFTLELTMTEDVFKHGYSEVFTVYVTENGGRYSGYDAEWEVKVNVRKQ